MEANILDEISTMVSTNRVVLFMKGNKNTPMCGFSGHVVNILKKLKLDFKDYDVLLRNDLRAGIKEFSNWPTIPQLYFKGEFIGGCNIIDQLYKDGQIYKILELDCEQDLAKDN